MEASIGMIVAAVLVIWYLGSSINSVLSGAGLLAEKEFKVFSRDQSMRHAKSAVKQTKELNTLLNEDAYSDEEFDKIFETMRRPSDEVCEPAKAK